MRVGKIYVLEGPDGAGKTTMANRIAKYLTKSTPSIPTVVFSFPNPKGVLYEKIREKLKHNDSNYKDFIQQMMIINMIDTIEKEVVPLLEKGINVIFDRWLVSSIVYNTLAKGTLLYSFAVSLNENRRYDKVNLTHMALSLLNDKITIPSKIFYIELPFELLKQHSINRMKDKDVEVNDTYEKVIGINCMYQEVYNAFVGKGMEKEEINLGYLGIPKLVSLTDIRRFDRHIKVSYQVPKGKELVERNVYEYIFRTLIKYIKDDLLK